MSNIEEDIKVLKNIQKLRRIEFKHCVTDREERAIQNILAEREQDKKRIKELEEKNKTLKNFTESIFNGDVTKDFIPVQKVKDKIEELKKEYEIALEENSTKAFILKCKISALEEFLEDK